MCIKAKLKMCKFPLKASVKKNQCKICLQKMYNLLAFVLGFPKYFKILKSNIDLVWYR